jgi:histidine triad (HIT) family protein
MVVSKDKNETSLSNASPDVIGHLMVIASKVAKQLDLVDGYRVVVDQGKNGKNVNIPVGNLFLNVIGGQQLSWPPYSNATTDLTP